MPNPGDIFDKNEDMFCMVIKYLSLTTYYYWGKANQFYSGNTGQHLDGSSKLVSLMIDIMSLQM